ncbi:MAG: hypothetical protein KDA57_17245, partial [Planctomycetales bacterium]|nr:hypothetical protein [Planctomycetales bacterium]
FQVRRAPPRDFRKRGHRKRMGFYGGVRINPMRSPKRLHSPSWGENPWVWTLQDEDTIVLSAYSCMDAVMLQLYYLVTALVDHLGLQFEGQKDLARLHKKYRVDCFERKVQDIFRQAGWITIGPINKIRVNDAFIRIPCGEIDSLALSPDHTHLLVVESKCLPLSTDPQMWHNDSTDFARKYVRKIEKKVEWCAENLLCVKEHFAAQGVHVELDATPVDSLFVTLRPHISALLQSRHRVMHLSRLESALQNSELNGKP